MSHYYREKYIGVIRVLSNKYAFIDKDNVTFELTHILDAFDKDLVEYEIIDARRITTSKKVFIKKTGQVTAIKRRNKLNFVVEIIKTGEFIVGRFENKKVVNTVKITNHPKAFLGEKVLITIDSFKLNDLKGTFLSSLGHKDEINVDIESIVQDLNIRTQFSEEINKEAAELTSKIEEFKASKKFVNLIEKQFFTVDPTDSKDFDDAITVEQINDHTYSVFVAIADVWSYLKYCPQISKETLERGSSVYLLNSVIPMLPFQLSNNLCSLVENEERNTLVVNFLVENGKIREDTCKIFPAIIKSRKRFNYEEINHYINHKTELQNVTPETLKALHYAYDCFKLLEVTRNKEGFLNVNRTSFKFQLNENNDIERIIKYRCDEAQKMIEVYMVYANLIVGNYFTNNNLPTIYRYHDYPDIRKIKKFLFFAKELNFYSERVDLENLTIFHINKWLNGNKSNENSELLTSLLLQSMQKAVYSTNNTFHFGLNLNNYLHFTSPIRRLPDLIVHKLLWMTVFDSENYKKEEVQRLKDDLTFIATNSTACEIKNSEAEHTVNKVKIFKYLRNKNKSVYAGVVVGRYQTGLQVRVENIYETFIKTNKELKLGSNILVKLLKDSGEFEFVRAL